MYAEYDELFSCYADRTLHTCNFSISFCQFLISSFGVINLTEFGKTITRYDHIITLQYNSTKRQVKHVCCYLSFCSSVMNIWSTPDHLSSVQLTGLIRNPSLVTTASLKLSRSNGADQCFPFKPTELNPCNTFLLRKKYFKRNYKFI